MWRLHLVVLAVLVSVALPGAAVEYVGKVVGIADGDTFNLLVKGERLRIRLAEIDTPEKGQPYGNRARQSLSALIYSKTVCVLEVDRDRYGRIVGRVYAGGLDVNAEMVRLGAAWVYRKYAKDRFLYELENEARGARRGIWVLPEAEREPPWRWREERREPRVSPAPASAVPQGAVIGNRRSLVYHRPDCPDYGKVSPKSRIYFDSRAAAEVAGFRQAGNCP
jgi:endonuclease YncB( thermonuclease family)